MGPDYWTPGGMVFLQDRKKAVHLSEGLCYGGPSVADEHRGLFKYEHLYNIFFRCGCLDHMKLQCRSAQPEPTTEKLWYGSWMQVESAARTSIVWTMNREGFLQEEEESSMLNIHPGPWSGSTLQCG